MLRTWKRESTNVVPLVGILHLLVGVHRLSVGMVSGASLMLLPLPVARHAPSMGLE